FLLIIMIKWRMLSHELLFKLATRQQLIRINKKRKLGQNGRTDCY
ncbi:conserved domain protein, partial [Listeria seeligeri FSL S4-171]